MKQPLGITLIVPPGQEATGVYEAVGGVEVFSTDTPYTLTDGKSLSPPLPIKIVTGETFTDSMGNAQTALAVSGLTSPPTNTALPTISGTAQVGQTLTATPGTWSGNPTPTYSYQWQRGTTNIAGATSATYTLVSADAGSTVRVVVTATNSAGSASANSANSATVTQAPSNTAPPEITGIAQVGETLTVSNGTWTGSPAPTYTRQWKSDGVNIAGATATTYVPVEADVGAVITCTVTATNSAGSANVTSAGTAPVAAVPVESPFAPFTVTAGTGNDGDTGYYSTIYGGVSAEPLAGHPLLEFATRSANYTQVSFTGDCVAIVAGWLPVIDGVTLGAVISDWAFDGEYTTGTWESVGSMTVSQQYPITWERA